MRTKLYAGIGSGMVMSLLVVGGIFLMLLGAGAPAEAAKAAKTTFCHLQKKVDSDFSIPPFFPAPGSINNGKVIEVSKAACFGHCQHGDQPLDPLFCSIADFGGEACIVGVVTSFPGCNVENCIAFCEGL